MPRTSAQEVSYLKKEAKKLNIKTYNLKTKLVNKKVIIYKSPKPILQLAEEIENSQRLLFND